MARIKFGSALKTARSRILFLLVLIILALGIGLAYWSLRETKTGVPAEVTLKSTPAIESTPLTGTPPSREYVQLQQEQNALEVEQAAKEGTSALPTITRAGYVGPNEFTKPTDNQGQKAGCNANELKRARQAGVRAEELRCKGCSAAELRAAGYTAGELMNSGFTAAELKKGGYSAAELRDAGFTASELVRGGYTPEEISAAGYSAAELAQAGVSAKKLSELGLKLDAKTPDCSIDSLRQSRQNGVTADKLRAMGCGAAAMKAAGYTAAELKAAGFSAGELRDAGFSAADLANAGYSAKQLREAGFGADELRAAGFTADQLKEAGFSDGELIRAGYNTEEVIPPAPVAVPSPAPAPADTTATTPPANGITDLTPVDDQDARSLSAIERLQQRQEEQLSAQERADLLQQMQTAMSTQATELFASWTPPPSQQLVVAPEEPTHDQTGAQSNSSLGPSSQAAISGGNNIVKAGSVQFAVLDTAINSDEQGPIMATIVQGPLKGGKVLGAFVRREKKVVLSFNLMNLPSLPNSIPINAYAIDANTARTALASDVNSHYLLRYGTLFASAFLSGLADAISESGSTETPTFFGTQRTTPPLNTGEKAMVALGNVGEQYSTVLGNNFTIPPTVKVNAGTGIGLLFMQDVSLTGSTPAPAAQPAAQTTIPTTTAPSTTVSSPSASAPSTTIK